MPRDRGRPPSRAARALQATPAGLLVGAAAFFVGIFAHEGVHGLGFRPGGLAWSQTGFGFHWQSGSPSAHAHAHAPMRASAYRAAGALPGLVTGLARPRRV